MESVLVAFENYAETIKLQSARNEFVGRLIKTTDLSNTSTNQPPQVIENVDNTTILHELSDIIDTYIHADRNNKYYSPSLSKNEKIAELNELQQMLADLEKQEHESTQQFNEKNEYLIQLKDKKGVIVGSQQVTATESDLIIEPTATHLSADSSYINELKAHTSK